MYMRERVFSFCFTQFSHPFSWFFFGNLKIRFFLGVQFYVLKFFSFFEVSSLFISKIILFRVSLFFFYHRSKKCFVIFFYHGSNECSVIFILFWFIILIYLGIFSHGGLSVFVVSYHSSCSFFFFFWIDNRWCKSNTHNSEHLSLCHELIFYGGYSFGSLELKGTITCLKV